MAKLPRILCRMRTLLRTAAVVFLLADASALAAPLVLRTAAQESSAPKFIEGRGSAQGLCPDILHALEKIDPDLRIDIDPTPTPIKRIESSLKAGQLEIVCALLDTPLRNEIAYRISTSIYAVREVLVARRDDTVRIRNFKELADTGDWVATQSGASYAAILRSYGVKVDESYGGSSGALRNLTNKRVRFFYINELTGAYYIKNEGLDNQLRLLPDAMQETPSYLWVSRRLDASVAQRVEKAVAKLKSEGILGKIYSNYQSQP